MKKLARRSSCVGVAGSSGASLSAEAVALGLPQEMGPVGPRAEEPRTPSEHSEKSSPAWFRRPEGRLILRKELSRRLSHVVHAGFVL